MDTWSCFGWLVEMNHEAPVTLELSCGARPPDQLGQGRGDDNATRERDAFFTFHTLAPGSSGMGMTNESKKAARVSNMAPFEVLMVVVSDIRD